MNLLKHESMYLEAAVEMACEAVRDDVKAWDRKHPDDALFMSENIGVELSASPGYVKVLIHGKTSAREFVGSGATLERAMATLRAAQKARE